MSSPDGWHDNNKTMQREQYQGGVVVAWLPHTLVGGNLAAPYFAAVPPQFRRPWGYYRNGCPLTSASNKVTVEPQSQRKENDVTTLQLNPLPTAESAPDAAAPPNPVTALVDKLLAADPPAGMDTLSKTYLALRDKAQEIDSAAKAKVAPVKQALERLEIEFLRRMTELGVDSVKTTFGTPYINTKTSVTTADAEPFQRFVLGNAIAGLGISPESKAKIVDAILSSGALAMWETRAAKTVVEQYIADRHEVPPGLNYRSEKTVNVRAK